MKNYNSRFSMLTAFIFVIGTSLSLFSEEYSIGPVANWVKAIEPDSKAREPNDASEGIYYLLLDNQTCVTSSSVQFYTHYAMKLVNKTGVEENSQIGITFDPSYEYVTLHKIILIRGEQRLNRLDKHKIKVLQREKDADYLIYDGSKELNLILEDVQIGDIIEVCYTKKGYNPVFKNAFAGTFQMQYSMPIKHVYKRLKKDKKSVLNLKFFNYQQDKKERYEDKNVDLIWENIDAPALIKEDETPGWYDPYPLISMTEYQSWEDLVRFGLELFEDTPAGRKPKADYSSIIASFGKKETSPEEAALNALRFVQRDIRYLGIEMGQSSYKPSQPADVLKRRFGDCKDKARLLTSLLGAMQMEAYPVFVDTYDGKVLEQKLPSPFLFDHVIVRLNLGEKVYWLDPTLEYQEGTLDTIYQPDYGFALTLKEGNKDLESMKKAPYEKPTIDVFQKFDLTSGKDNPGIYEVTSRYYGEDADNKRSRYANSTKKELQDDYLNYLAQDYSKIEIAKEFSYEDSKKENCIVQQEYYSVPEIWKYNETEKRHEIDFYPYDLGGYIVKPSRIKRSMPYSLYFPLNVQEKIEVKLSPGWRLDKEKFTITNANFSYKYERTFKHNILTLSHSYKTLKDHVSVAEMPAFLKDIEKIRSGISYQIWEDDGTKADDDSPVHYILYTIIVVVSGIIYLRWRISNARKKQVP